MNRTKSFLLVLVIILIMIGVCGCMKVDNMETKAEQTKKEAFIKLEENNLISKEISINMQKMIGFVDGFKEIVYGSDFYLSKLASDPDQTAQKNVLKYFIC